MRESGLGARPRMSLGTTPLGFVRDLAGAFVLGFFVMALWYGVQSLETIIVNTQHHHGRI